MTRRPWTPKVLVVAVGILLAFASSIAADEPPSDKGQSAEQKQGQEQPPAGGEPALKSQAPAKGGSSLAAAAAGIKLTQPASDGSVVISNASLKKSASKGTVSVGGGVTSASAAAKPAPASAAGEKENPANAVVQQYNEQLRTVEGLEARLKNFDEQLKAPARDPHYAYVTGRPHDRAPGVQDPASVQRDALAKQLEAERTKLNTLREQARRQGIELH